MAIDLGNGFVVSDSVVTGKHKTTDAERASAVLNQYGGLQGIANSGMSLTKLLEALSGAKWNIPLFDNITAGQALSAYQKGTLPSTGDAKKAIQSGEYDGTVQDYMNENIAKAIGVEYTKGSGNQTLDDLNNAVGAAPSTSSSGTSYLDQLTAIQNSGNAPSANMEGWADSFINKLGKAQSGGDSKEDAFNKMWANYAEGNPDHASPELQAVLRQMAGLDGGNSGNAGASMPSNPVVNSGASVPYTPPSTDMYGGGSSSSGTGGTFPGTFPNTSGSSVGGGTSGGVNDAFAQYLANVTDSGYNKQMSGSIADLEGLYKELFGNIQSGDYTKKPYYQTILESYGLAGDAAADDAVAGSVGSNGGNLDSYAAANAKRQQLAYKNAAQGAALDAYNAEIGNLIKTLGDMGVNVNDLYATWAQNLASERGTAADVLLGQLGIDRDKYVTDAQAAVDKYLGELGLEGTKVQADTNKYLGQLGAETDRYLGELSTNLGMSQIEADKYLGELGLEGTKVQADANKNLGQLGAETDRYLAELNAALSKNQIDSDRYLGELNASLGMSQIEADKQMNADKLAAQKELAQMESALQMLVSEIQSATDIRKQELIKEAALAAAKLEAQAAKYGYDVGSLTEQNVQLLKNEAAKYGYDMEYLMATGGYSGGGEAKAEEATATQKQKALEIHRTLGDAAFEEFIASFPEDVQQSLRAYDAQYYVDESKVIPDAEAQGIAMNIANAVNQGADATSALDYWLTKHFAQHPEHNTSQTRTKIFELVVSILQ